MPNEKRPPWDREYLAASVVNNSLGSAIIDLELALKAAEDSFMRAELMQALTRTRLAQLRARRIFQNQSLKHAEQVELIATEGDELARECGGILDDLEGGLPFVSTVVPAGTPPRVAIEKAIAEARESKKEG